MFKKRAILHKCALGHFVTVIAFLNQSSRQFLCLLLSLHFIHTHGFGSFRSATTHSTIAIILARLAGRYGLRVLWLCCLRFTLAIKSVPLCIVPFLSRFLFEKNTKTCLSTPHIAAKHIRSSCFSLQHPLLHSQGGSLSLGLCPQTVPLFAHSAHRWLKAVLPHFNPINHFVKMKLDV